MTFVDQINVVGPAAGLSTRSIRSLHNLRIHGNQAVHHHLSGVEEAMYGLALCEELLAAAFEAVPSLAAAAAPEAAADPEPDPPETTEETDSLVRSVHLLKSQFDEHQSVGLRVPARLAQQLIPSDALMTLTTSGISVKALQRSGLLSSESNSGSLQTRNDMAGLGCLGFRWAPNDVIKFVAPPERPVIFGPGLSPPGAAYFNALCTDAYWEGSMSTQNIQQHMLRALSLTRIDWLERPKWPRQIHFAELNLATRAAFQWSDSTRQLLGKAAPKPALIWFSLMDKHAPDWVVDLKAARPVY